MSDRFADGQRDGAHLALNGMADDSDGFQSDAICAAELYDMHGSELEEYVAGFLAGARIALVGMGSAV